MPVTYAVNRNIVGIPVLASNIAAKAGSTINFAIPDNQGNVYVGGTFQGYDATAIFLPNATLTGPGTNTANTLTLASQFTPLATGSNSGFLAKYYSTGGLAWAIPFGNVAANSNVFINSCAIDPTNYANVYVGLTYTATSASILINGAQNAATQTASAVSLPLVNSSGAQAGQTGGAVVKINASGAIQWASVIESSTLNETGIATAVDLTGALYLTSTYASTATINILNGVLNGNPAGTTVTIPPVLTSGSTALALVKYTNAGVAQWSTVINDTTAAQTEALVSGSSIAIDTQSNVYITGTYTNSATASTLPIFLIATTSGGSGTGINLPYGFAGTTNGFLVKYSTAGTLQWASVLSNTTAGSNSSVNYVTTSGYNTLYICGNVAASTTTTIYNGVNATTAPSSGTVTLPATTLGGVPNTPYYTPNAFLAKYLSNGACQYASYIPTSNLSTFNSIAVDPSDANLYVTGKYSNAATVNIINGNNSVTTTLPLAQYGSGLMIRYFIGNALAATSAPIQGSNIIGTYTGYNFVAIDPTVTNVYTGGSYFSSTGTQALYNSSPLGGTNTTFNMTLPNTGTANTSNTNGYWVKFG